jgi:hypothetical protein
LVGNLPDFNMLKKLLSEGLGYRLRSQP